MSNRPINHKMKLFPILCLLGAFLSAPTWSDDSLAKPEIQTITHGMSLARSCEQALLSLDKRYDVPAPNNTAFICMAYLNGVMATAQHANEKAKLEFALAITGEGNPLAFNIFCFDWQQSFQKIAAIVLTYAQKNPTYLQRPANELVMRALQTAYPCR